MCAQPDLSVRKRISGRQCGRCHNIQLQSKSGDVTLGIQKRFVDSLVTDQAVIDVKNLIRKVMPICYKW